MTDTDESALRFPCRFPIKAMGLARDDLYLHIIEIVEQHVPDLNEEDITQRASSNGKYLSVTVTIEATSREQLDAIYQALTDCEHVMMAL